MHILFRVPMIMLSGSIVLSTTVASAQSSAARGSGSSSQPGATTSNAASSTATSATTSTAAPVATPQAGGYGSAGNMNSSAKDSKAQATMGAALNGTAAAYWFSRCSSDNWTACALGAMHVAQAGMMLKGASGAGKTQKATMHGMGVGLDEGTYGSDFGGTGGLEESTTVGGNDPLSGRIAAEQKRINDLSSRFNALGYKVSDDGRSLTLPNGKSVPTSAFSVRSGLASLGLTAQQIDEHERLKAALAAKMKDQVKALTLEEGGANGAGGGRGRGREATGDREGDLNFGALFGENKGRKTASVKGLSKQLGSDRIGVQADNIFEMISRQYQKEEGKQSFIPAAGAVTPAAGR